MTAERVEFYWFGVAHTTDKSLVGEVLRELNFGFLSVAGLLGLGLALKRRVPGAWLFSVGVCAGAGALLCGDGAGAVSPSAGATDLRAWSVSVPKREAFNEGTSCIRGMSMRDALIGLQAWIVLFLALHDWGAAGQVDEPGRSAWGGFDGPSWCVRRCGVRLRLRWG